MLQTKLFRGFAIVVVIFAVLSAVVGIRFMQRRVLEEAQTRVRLDLESAWAVYNSKLREIETVIRLASAKQVVVERAGVSDWDDADLRNRMERIRASFNLDFLGVVSPDGQVVMRTTPPYATGDSRVSDGAVREAMRGHTKTCMMLMSRTELEREAVGLADRAYFEVDQTPKARKSRKVDESRGMVMVSAAPILKGMEVLGVVYGGILVNRNHDLIDGIQKVVYKNETYKDAPLGTATIFLQDCRIATTVRKANGNRAMGTMVSKEVADQVLDNGKPWIGDAFVVRDWYLTAYEPIRDCSDRIIGMLYVGILKTPFADYSRRMITRYAIVSVIGLVFALFLAFIMAKRLADPIHRLVEAANRTANGERPDPVPADDACHETETLIHAFNQMTRTLAEREQKLTQLNRSYMETLGFVSHELKSPLSSMLNYLYLLKEGKLGDTNQKQDKAISVINSNVNRLVEMVRHYLNLSRIENNEYEPALTKVDALGDVLNPLIDSFRNAVTENEVTVDCRVGEGTELNADLNMVREVFENLMSNALKYGRRGGRITISSTLKGGFVEFAFRNEGEGIPEEKAGALFQKFSRLNGAEVARSQKGSGLGLFITKHIVEAHGGAISAQSEPGEWTEFVFTLPAHTEEEKEPNVESVE